MINRSSYGFLSRLRYLRTTHASGRETYVKLQDASTSRQFKLYSYCLDYNNDEEYFSHNLNILAQLRQTNLIKIHFGQTVSYNDFNFVGENTTSWRMAISISDDMDAVNGSINFSSFINNFGHTMSSISFLTLLSQILTSIE